MEDFQKLISEAKAQYKPQCDFSALPHEALIYVFVVTDFLSRKCVIRILSHGKPDLSVEDVARYAGRIVRNLNPEHLAFLYQIYPQRDPLSFLVELDCNMRDIVAEMDKRIEPYELSRLMVGLEARPWEQSRINSLLKHLHIEKMEVHKKKKRRQDDEDLQGIGLKAAAEGYRKLKDNAIGKLKGFRNPSLPKDLNIPRSDKPPWDKLNPVAFTKTFEDAVRGLLPAFQDEMKDLRYDTHQGLHAFWQESKAEIRGGARGEKIRPWDRGKRGWVRWS